VDTLTHEPNYCLCADLLVGRESPREQYEGRANMDRVSSLPSQDFDGMVAEIWQTLFEPSLPRGGQRLG